MNSLGLCLSTMLLSVNGRDMFGFDRVWTVHLVKPPNDLTNHNRNRKRKRKRLTNDRQPYTTRTSQVYIYFFGTSIEEPKKKIDTSTIDSCHFQIQSTIDYKLRRNFFCLWSIHLLNWWKRWQTRPNIKFYLIQVVLLSNSLVDKLESILNGIREFSEIST